MKVIITKTLIKNLKSAMLDLDELAYMISLFEDQDWGIEINDGSDAKLKALGYVDRYADVLTSSGINLLERLAEKKVELDETAEKEFLEYWNAYPDTYEDRKIRTGYEDTRSAFKQIRSQFSFKEIMDGLEAEVSHRRGAGSMRYIKSPTNFLLNKVFLDHKNNNNKGPHLYGQTIA